MGIYAGFSPTIFRMAMKAHRQGHDTTKLLGLISYRTINNIQHGFVEQHKADARIQDGSLLVRHQRIFMIPSSQKLPLPWNGGCNICTHPPSWRLMEGLYLYGIRIPFADKIEGYENRQGIIYCWYCYTEFRVDFKSYGEAGNAMFVTKWMDMGDGRDVEDLKWKTRFKSRYTEVRFKRGSICAAFEQKAASEFKFDSLLTQQDEKDLCTKSPWLWPENKEVSFDGKERFRVINGRIRT